ncbi:ABC transporter permease [Maritalea sp.]|jgi:putative ABC transport system permease protein|uniref:ABC transporter permease n=1 Tax=Maritalea sp. TaxID=2003361 RepID=UPI0039E56C55
MLAIRAAVRTGLLDMRGDLRRFVLLVICLAVGTALIAGVGFVGASITRAVDLDAAKLMGGDLELSRADRWATEQELEQLAGFGTISTVLDTNLRAQAEDRDAFVDLMAIGETYPLLGQVLSQPPQDDSSVFEFLSETDGVYGALIDPLMLDQLDLKVGDTFNLGGTTFQARGQLLQLPDGPVRGYRLGLTTLITTAGLRTISDRSSPLPGLGNWFRYKLLLENQNRDSVKADLERTFADSGWTVRTARDGLGAMVRYYDQFMRFLVIVGLGSLLIGGVSVWTGMQAYIAERSSVIAVMRSMGAARSRIFVHFFSQVTMLATVGVIIGLTVGLGTAIVLLPLIGEAIGVNLAPTTQLQPALVAAGSGFLTAFAFSYIPLQQAQAVRPVLLFRAKGLSVLPMNWHALAGPWQILLLIISIVAFVGLAFAMTGDLVLVAAFGAASALSAIALHLFVRLIQTALSSLPEPSAKLLRRALRAILGSGSNASAVVVSVGMAMAMLILVMVLQTNLRQEFLGASAFDVPTLVAADLFPDEVEIIEDMVGPRSDITFLDSLPMLRSALVEINNAPAASVRTRGPEATFLLSGEVPVTFRTQLPKSSKIVAGEWWPENYQGPGLVSLHQSLRSGLGVDIGDTLTFAVFGEWVTVKIANFRDYSWQGGIDFLVTFSPGVLEQYPTTLFAAVTAAPGRENAVERVLATALRDVRFIAIGDTLKQITGALSQLSVAASLVGGLAVGNGLLVLIGSLATGRRQREADTLITRVLGATRWTLIATALVQYCILAAIAALPATLIGVGLGWLVSLVMLDVDFTLGTDVLGVVLLLAIFTTTLLGGTTILRAASARPARLLRDL